MLNDLEDIIYENLRVQVEAYKLLNTRILEVDLEGCKIGDQKEGTILRAGVNIISPINGLKTINLNIDAYEKAKIISDFFIKGIGENDLRSFIKEILKLNTIQSKIENINIQKINHNNLFEILNNTKKNEGELLKKLSNEITQVILDTIKTLSYKQNQRIIVIEEQIYGEKIFLLNNLNKKLDYILKSNYFNTQIEMIGNENENQLNHYDVQYHENLNENQKCYCEIF